MIAMVRGSVKFFVTAVLLICVTAAACRQKPDFLYARYLQLPRHLTCALSPNTSKSHKIDRHVILPKELAKTLPKTRLLTENEWRSIGVQQSRGWEHYAIHRPEPHILLFRRPLGTDPQTGAVNLELKRQALEEYKGQFGLRGN